MIVVIEIEEMCKCGLKAVAVVQGPPLTVSRPRSGFTLQRPISVGRGQFSEEDRLVLGVVFGGQHYYLARSQQGHSAAT